MAACDFRAATAVAVIAAVIFVAYGAVVRVEKLVTDCRSQQRRAESRGVMAVVQVVSAVAIVMPPPLLVVAAMVSGTVMFVAIVVPAVVWFVMVALVINLVMFAVVPRHAVMPALVCRLPGAPVVCTTAMIARIRNG